MTVAKAHIDFETRSAIDLVKSGVYRYAESPSTEVICMSWRLGDGPVQRWRPGEEFPVELAEHKGLFVAHNASFERTIWNAKVAIGDERGNCYPTPMRPEAQDCTLSRAVVLALPAGLAGCGAALGADVQKDDAGHRLMMKMCKPRSVDQEHDRVVWWDDPADIERLQAYCDQDVLAECAIDKKLPPLSERERRVWILDQTINDRGVAVDVHLVSRALEVVEEATKRANNEMWRLTEGAVDTVTKTAKIISWVNARGVPCTSIAKGEIEELVLGAQLQSDDVCEKVIRLRRAAARSSTAKLKTILKSVSSDGRARGTLAYHGASTGRWAGRLMQPQNFPRIDGDTEMPDVMRILSLLQSSMAPAEIVDAIELIVGAPMEWMSKCLRPMIVAAPSNRLLGADFSNIEGRVNAWLAREEWKLDAFRAFDAGVGHDLYKLSYGRSFGIDFDDVTKANRQIGKVQELALGYQGGPGAFVNMAANYGIRPADIAEATRRVVPDEHWDWVKAKFREQDARGLDVETWTGIKIVVNGWREANPNIVQGWWDLQDAAVEAVAAPGVIVPVYGGKVRYRFGEGFLWCMLPSGRVLAYAAPSVIWQKTGFLDRNGDEQSKRVVAYWGTDPITKKWKRHTLYGGEQCNHVVQGTARDILVDAMFRVEEARYPLVLTVHDENLSEVEQSFGSLAEYQALMNQKEKWTGDCPIVAVAYEDTRWVK